MWTLAENILNAITQMFMEIYDIRCTCNTMLLANKHINQALQGIQKHCDATREVHAPGRFRHFA